MINFAILEKNDMKISYNWLKQYIKTDLSAERVAEILTDTGLEVEGLTKIEAVTGGLQGVVVGEVLSCEKHPDADRLKITNVNVGSEVLQIICGAPNVDKGQKVVVATPGTSLYPEPDKPFKIKKAKIRGIESCGMICAEDELGIGNSHDGVIILEDSMVPGTPAAEVFNMEDDYVFDIGLTPNRADAMGHIGVARDLKAYLNVHSDAKLQLQWPEVKDLSKTSELQVDVQVENTEACPRYTGTTITGVHVKPSPEWLQNRLRAIGLNPINNVVDVTNFVMHELGTPLHAFDADKLHHKVVVRNAQEKEKFVTLDAEERELSSSHLMITNGTESLCIAGVFGGMDSGITEHSKDIFLESAYFNPVSVRQTAKSLTLSTDSSFRFERGVDPSLTIYALKRASNLIMEIAGGEIGMECIDTNSQVPKRNEIDFDVQRCNVLIGEQIPTDTIVEILNQLDFECLSENNGAMRLAVPTYRVDVTREADVIEEVLRIYGFNRIPVPEKLNSSINNFPKPDQEKVQQVISDTLVGLGYYEMMNNSLTKELYATNLGGNTINPNTAVQIMNPLSRDLNVMRQSLIFSALETVGYNQNRQNPNVKFFEFGKTYNKFDSGYTENRRLCLAISGRKNSENWNDSNENVTYYSIKSYVNVILEKLGLSPFLKEKELKSDLYADGMKLYINKTVVGEIGWVNQKLKSHFGIKNDVFIADLDWDNLVDCLKMSKIKYSELPKTFAVRRDFSLLLDKAVSFAEISALAKETDRQLLKEVGLFDVYEGKNLEAGKKSYAVSFKFQDATKTLKDEDVDRVMNRIRENLEVKLGAQLR